MQEAKLSKINSSNYVELALSTCSPKFHVEKITPGLLHAAFGMVTEAGEFADALKKAMFYGKDLDRTNLIEELGDSLWYIAIACHELGIDLDQVFGINIAKLKARFPEKFEEHKSLFRDLEKEREILEAGEK